MDAIRTLHDEWSSRIVSFRCTLVALGVTLGVLLGVHFTLGAKLLANPVGIVAVSLTLARIGWIGSVGPSIRHRTGESTHSRFQAVGVPLIIVALGVLGAAILERTNLAPVAQAALFAPWWSLFLLVAFSNERGLRSLPRIQDQSLLLLVFLALVVAMGMFALSLSFV